MKHLGEMLRGLTLPDAAEARPPTGLDAGLVHDLGAGLPGGHVHLWGGPPGAGKTSFLLSLLYGAAASGRRVVYATYHLSAETLALRLLAMGADVDPVALARGELTPAEASRAAGVRATIERLPFGILEARGFSVGSIDDRVVRMPFRPEVLAVDYLQAVIRRPGSELGEALRDFAGVAARRHVAVICALEAGDKSSAGICGLADRAGWIAPSGGSGARRAEVIENRYGARPTVPLRFDERTGTLHRLRED